VTPEVDTQAVARREPSNETMIEREAGNSVLSLLKKYERSFKGVLPKHLTPDRFAWLTVNSIRQTPALAGCNGPSFINAVLLAANMGLEIRRNSCYLIPFGKECQLLIDYRGKIDLARRSGKVGAVTVELVREYDLFEYERTHKGTTLRHRPMLLKQDGGKMLPVSDRGEVVLGYACADLIGFESCQVEIMSLDQIEGIRRRAKSGRAVPFQHYRKEYSGLTLADIRAKDPATMAFSDPYRVPWVTDWDQMARKTIMHRLCNYLPQSSELLMSQEADESLETEKPLPAAAGIEAFMLELDPADNQAMVPIPEGTEEQREAQEAVVERKTGVKPVHEVAKLPDPVPLTLGTKMRCKGVDWTVVDTEDGYRWQKEVVTEPEK
jgi:recombination protein RecT